ncbi:MAG: protoporphyrinogen oxidase [Verrucomicrobiota bacterium]
MKKVAIVGGGITGLSCAYYILKAGASDVEVTLFESTGVLGGKIKTVVDSQGRIVEAGPDSIVTTKPAGIRLMKELGLEDQIINPTTTKSFILHGDVLRRIPPDFMSLVPKNMLGFLMSDLFSVRGKIRLLCEKWIRPAKKGEDESLGEFVTRRCGAEVSERFAEPLFAGIFASNANEISIKASFPHWKNLEEKFGSITAGVLAQTVAPKSAPTGTKHSAFISLKGGMQRLVEALVDRLHGVRLRLNTAISGMERRECGGYFLRTGTGEPEFFDSVVVATPAYVAASLLSTMAPGVQEQLDRIAYTSTLIVSLVFARSDVAHLPNATGFVVSAKEKYSFTGCSWSSNKWEYRTGKDELLIRCFYGKAGNDEISALPDNEIVELATKELAEVLTLRDAKVRAVYVHRYPRAMPQYEVGHLDKIAELKKRLTILPNVHLAGAAYGGVGIPDCVRQGMETAESVVSQMGGNSQKAALNL